MTPIWKQKPCTDQGKGNISRIVCKICNPGGSLPNEKVEHGDRATGFMLMFRFFYFRFRINIQYNIPRCDNNKAMTPYQHSLNQITPLGTLTLTLTIPIFVWSHWCFKKNCHFFRSYVVCCESLCRWFELYFWTPLTQGQTQQWSQQYSNLLLINLIRVTSSPSDLEFI